MVLPRKSIRALTYLEFVQDPNILHVYKLLNASNITDICIGTINILLNLTFHKSFDQVELYNNFLFSSK